MTREPLTVLIPTFNEARNLPACLESVRDIADEIFVVDSFSDDATCAIATAAGARIARREFLNDADQKNWALPQCRHRWVLILDADERATPSLRDEIEALLADPPSIRAAAFSIARTTFLLDVEIRYCGWNRDRVIRLFDRTRARYPDLEVHGDLEVDGPVHRLSGRIEHFTYRTLDEYIDKLRRYTTWSANDLWKRGRRAKTRNLVSKPILRFAKMYVWQRGFLDGVAGLIVCGLAATSVFMRYAKLWSMQRAVASRARWPDGRPIIHAGAAIIAGREIISGGTAATGASPTRAARST